VNDDKDADVVVGTAVAMGCRAGRDGRVRIVFGEYDGSTILVLPESFFLSSLIDIFVDLTIITNIMATTEPSPPPPSGAVGVQITSHPVPESIRWV